MPNNDALGIFLALSASFLSGLSYSLMKRGHLQRDAAAQADAAREASAAAKPTVKAPLYRNASWLMGFACMLVAAGLAVACYPLLDQSKQAPMGAITIVWNVMLAGLILGEKVLVLDGICTGIIISGTVLAVANSDATSKTFTFAEILGLLQDDIVYAYSTVISVTMVAAIVFIEQSTRLSKAKWSPRRAAAMAVITPAVGGMCNGLVAYTVKANTTVLTSAEWSELKNPVFYVYSVLSILIVLAQVRYLNAGLGSFGALQVVPTYQSFIIFSNALSGIVYYHDMRTAPAWKLLLFALGGCMCVLGLALLRLKARVLRDDAEQGAAAADSENVALLRSSGQADGTAATPRTLGDAYAACDTPERTAAAPPLIAPANAPTPWWAREIKDIVAAWRKRM